jgi:flagellin
MIVNHNLPAMNANIFYNKQSSQVAKTLEKLSSGYKINRAADDSAGMAISEKMRAQMRGLEQDERNIDDGISMFNVAEGGMQTIENMVHRIRELAVQASHDTYTDADRALMQEEVDRLISGIDDIAHTTEFNTHKLLSGQIVEYTVSTRYFTSGATWDSPSIINAMNTIGGNWDRHDSTVTNPANPSPYAPNDGALNSSSNLRILNAQTGAIIGSTNYFGIDDYIDQNYGNLPSTYGNPPTLATANQFVTALAAAMTQAINNTPAFAGQGIAVTGSINPTGNFSFIIGNGQTYGIAFGSCINQGLIDGDHGTNGSIAHQLMHSTFGANATTETTTEELFEGNKYIIQAGPNTDQNILFDIPPMPAKVVGITDPQPARVIVDADITTQATANDTIELCDIALEYVSTSRALLGSYTNRLEHAKGFVNVANVNMTNTYAKIVDADMATYAAEISKYQVLQEAAKGALAQANQITQTVLSLLK